MIQTDQFEATLSEAVKSGKLLDSAKGNILLFLKGRDLSARRSVEELVGRMAWEELNDRFYKNLSFGTGGMRGRTIGKIVTFTEQGAGGAYGAPEFAAAGTNCMNEANLKRATRGLMRYLFKIFPNEPIKVVFSHDTRHFSRHFAELAASLVARMGGKGYLFPRERSTPELSFAVRYLGAHAAAMITASHNPPHDNGFKVYFQDGGQIVEPHASGIIQEVEAVGWVDDQEERSGGEVIFVEEEVDRAYLDSLKELVIEKDVLRQSNLKIVYTPLHGAGMMIMPRLFEELGCSFKVEPAQEVPDGRFPTVSSPNPENPEAFVLALKLAKQEKADLVFATDPDADRMGVAVERDDGSYQLLTGNQTGSILAAYRLERLFAQGVLTAQNASHAALIKTFVTTDLQKAIASKYGVKCVETLTGFKYIGSKLLDYEQDAGGKTLSQSAEEWRAKLLEKSTFYVFGGEESYGYSVGDSVRDKDAHAGVLLCIEAAAWLRKQGMSLLDYLNRLYLEYGFYWERLGALTFEGAEGAEKIQKLLRSYRSKPPTGWCGRRVEKIQDFSEETFFDVDGKEIPKELMLIFLLEDNFRVAVRASGTEPKIKFYFFGHAHVKSSDELSQVQKNLVQVLDKLWEETQEDVKKRVG